MDETVIRNTVATLDKALARIALAVSGSPALAQALLAALDQGQSTAETRAFLSEGAALIRARLLLADAITVSPRPSLRKVA